MATSIIKLPAVIARTGLSRSTIYHKISLGQFPQSIPLGVGNRTRAVGWVDDDVEGWIQEQIDRARGGNLERLDPFVRESR